MQPFIKKLLATLVDTYERSSLARGTNKINRQIVYKFQKKNVPSYFDESSGACEEIHAILEQLEHQGFINIVWKNGKKGSIVQQVVLCLEALPSIYAALARTPQVTLEQEALKFLEAFRGQEQQPVLEYFVTLLDKRIKSGKSVKEYVDISNANELSALLTALKAVETNTSACFVRELSLRVFHDSKKLEALENKVCRIIKEALPTYAELENLDVLAEYQVYHTPGYVYFKGDAFVQVRGTKVPLGAFSEGIGLSLGLNNEIELQFSPGSAPIEKVYTVENLTSFFTFVQPRSLIVYLGGYHNSQRRELLKKIFAAFPQAEYYHFGDIDAGGFYIYRHLVERTAIPFRTYRMDVETLKTYAQYGKTLTEQDRVRLKQLAAKCPSTSMVDTINYMLEHNIKLEQECVN